MQTIKQVVRSEKEVVGIAEFAVFESVAESINKLGENTVLSMVNAQHKLQEMNAVRNTVCGKMTKEQVMVAVLAMIPPQELAEVGGDPAAAKELFAKYSNIIESQAEARAEAMKAAARDLAASEQE